MTSPRGREGGCGNASGNGVPLKPSTKIVKRLNKCYAKEH